MSSARRMMRGTLLGAALAAATMADPSGQGGGGPRVLQVLPAPRLTLRAGDSLDAGFMVSVGADAPGEVAMAIDGVGLLRNGFVLRGYPAGIFVCPGGRCVPCPVGTRCFHTGQHPIDPRTRLGRHDVGVTFTDSRGRIGRATLDVEVTPALDADADGLPDAWEALYGLDPRSAGGDDGPDGDPDGDGVRNRDELTAWSTPRGRYQRLFAEASAGNRPPGVTHCFDVAGPDRRSGGGWLTLIGDDGRRAVATLGHGYGFGWECALHPVFNEADRVVAALVESADPMIVERSGLLTTYGVGAPSSRWLFADGGTDGELDTFYLAYNPTNAPSTARFTYREPGGTVLLRTTRELPPGRRTTVWLNADEPALGRREASVEVESSAPILLERAWRFDPPGRTVTQAGATPGTATPATRWYFGEMDASLPFDTTLVVANPDTRTASITLSYYFAGYGALRSGPLAIPAGGRLALPARRMGPLTLGAAAVELTSTHGVVAERSYSGRDDAGPWRVAVSGATETGTEWTLGAVYGYAQSVVIVNPSPLTARLRLEFSVVSQSGNMDSTNVVDVPPRQRLVHELWKDPRRQTTGTLRMTSLPGPEGRIAPVFVERVDRPVPPQERRRPGVLAGTRVR